MAWYWNWKKNYFFWTNHCTVQWMRPLSARCFCTDSQRTIIVQVRYSRKDKSKEWKTGIYDCTLLLPIPYSNLCHQFLHQWLHRWISARRRISPVWGNTARPRIASASGSSAQTSRPSACPRLKINCAVLRIRDPESFWHMDPGSGMGKKSGSGSGMNNLDHISESLETFFGLKYLNSLMRIRDPWWQRFGSGINIPDPTTMKLWPVNCCMGQ